MYYFVRITPANFLYAFWLSLRQPVAAWKVELPERLARRFERVRPYRLLSRDEWLLAHDKAFDVWKSDVFPLLSASYHETAAIGGRTIDFSRNLWQLLGMEFEALSLFASMLEKAQGQGRPRVIEPRIGTAFDDATLARMFPSIVIVRSAANRALENLHEWLFSLAHLARQVIFLGLSFSARIKAPRARRIAWLGISPQEIPDRDDRLDFTWPVRYGHAARDDVLFFLPQALTPAQRTYLDSRDVACVEPSDSYALLPAELRFKVVAESFAGFMKALIRPSLAGPLVARFMSRAPYWDALFTELGVRTYVTTTSYSWPEKPELAVTSARGIRSVIWAYSANSLTFTIGAPEFRDVGVLRSIVIADEFWVWNDAYCKWLSKRRVEAAESLPKIRVSGALMCGDAALLGLDPATARKRLALPTDGLCIGVFDMPPISDSWRDRFGGGPPMVDTPTYIEFWKTIEHVIRNVPGAFALIKLKREFSHTYREFPEYLRALLDENGEHVKAGRLRKVDVNIDPYLPVAACDIAIGIAYTSPVLAALSAGKPGYYLDPLRRANFPSDTDYELITLHTIEDTVNAVVRARNEQTGAVRPESITPPPPHVPLAEPAASP